MCKEFACGNATAEMFAPTPLFLANRWLFSHMASQVSSGPGSMRPMALDFSKAILYGNMEAEVCIELPPEDGRKQGSLWDFCINQCTAYVMRH